MRIGMYSAAIPYPKAPMDPPPSYRPLYAPLLPLYNRYYSPTILYYTYTYNLPLYNTLTILPLYNDRRLK